MAIKTIQFLEESNWDYGEKLESVDGSDLTEDEQLAETEI